MELTRKGGPTPGGKSIEGSTPSRHSQVENQKENPKVYIPIEHFVFFFRNYMLS